MVGRSLGSDELPFGAALRRLRLAAGMTQEQLGLESGVQRNFISLIELGQNQPTIGTIVKLARAMLSTAPDRYAKAVREWQAALQRAPSAPSGAVSMPTPAVFRALGVKADSLALPARYLHGILQKHADMPAAVLRDLPHLLSDPLVVVPYSGGGYRALLAASTAKGEPIVAGIGADGRVQTVTPLNDDPNMAGAERFALSVE